MTKGGKRDRLSWKESFYNGLASPDSDDEQPDLGRLESAAALQNPTAKRPVKSNLTTGTSKPQTPVIPQPVVAAATIETPVQVLPRPALAKVPPRSPVRSVSDGANMPQEKSAVDPQPDRVSEKARRVASKPVPSLQQRHTITGAVPSMTGKRKRDKELPVLPEEQHIFKNYHFYFFPNNDGHPARRMRILKALQFGATWQKEYSSDVTHVVMDNNMDYALLIKFLEIDTLPHDVVLVNESWPSDCVAYRSLLDPTQYQFRVKGAAPPLKVAAIPKDPSTDSVVSLKLKPAGKAVTVRQPQTQSSIEGLPPRRAQLPSAGGISEEVPAVEERVLSVASTREFDAAIKQAKELQHISFDDDEAPHRPASADGPSTDDEEAPPPSQDPTRVNPKKKYNNWQDKFQCMSKHTGENSNNPNTATILVLQQMADYYGQTGDEWRIRAYRKAIATLRNHPTRVWTKEEALALPNVGARLAEKIEEIAITNKLRRLDNARAEPSDQVLRTFMQVYGAGPVQAGKWVSEGYTSLDELYQKAPLTDNQRIGIEHYNDFITRIPRAEVAQHGAIVRAALQKLNPDFEVIVGGSYRRGAQNSGDIDCIITHPTASSEQLRTTVLDRLVPSLMNASFLVASLAITSRDDGSKWHGASCLPHSKIWRRIDLLIVPPDEIGAALIYFTGNDIFNRSLRLLASKKGMRLNQRGLYKEVMRGQGRVKLTEGTLVEGRDEKKIFEVLGVPWRPPEHRIC